MLRLCRVVVAVVFSLISNLLVKNLYSSTCEAFSLSSSSSFVGQRLSTKKNDGCYSSSLLSSSWTMKIRIGILGLPNVGKSTLFNALARQSIAQAANFPFCTIDPNIAQVEVPDKYLHRLGELAQSTRTVPATVEWVDVAGLARGAHRGEGLGNRFLGTLRDCQAICHVVRVFDDPNIVHVDGRVDAMEDIDAINLELLFADLSHVERRLEKTNVPELERRSLEKILAGLKGGVPARALTALTEEEIFSVKSMGLLTLKPMMYAFNVDEADYVLGRDEIESNIASSLPNLDFFDPTKELWTLVSAKVEEELSLLPNDEALEYLSTLGIENGEEELQTIAYNGLPKLAQKLLNLSILYTGPGVPPERSRTTRAHIFSSATSSSSSSSSSSFTADQLAGRLHGDIQKGFMRAEVIQASRLLDFSTYVEAKDEGCIRSEGREYVTNHEDVILIKWK